MSRSLPEHPSLHYLKQQAKHLLRAYRTGDLNAQQQVAHYLPSLATRSGPSQMLLAHALTVLARQYGFVSWPKLKQHVEDLQQIAALPVRNAAAEGHPNLGQQTQQRVQVLATAIQTAAENGDLNALFVALTIPARDIAAARAVLVDHHTYTPVIDLLITGVRHPQTRVRFLSAQAMDHFADERCAEPLRMLLEDPIPRVRWAALHSLQCGTCKLQPLEATTDIVPTVIALAGADPSAKVRRVATYELGQLCHDPRALAALETLQIDAADPVVRRHARQALQRKMV